MVKRFDYIWKNVKDDRGLSELAIFFIDNFSNKEYDLSDEKDIGYFLDLLDGLSEENEQLRNKLEVANARSSYYQRMLKKWCIK